MVSYLGESIAGVPLATSIWNYLQLHLSAYKTKGQRVTTLKTDPEGCFGANRLNIQDAQVAFVPSTKENKCSSVERRIQYIKDKDRAFKAGLPFPLFGALLVFCVLNAVHLTIFSPLVASPIGVSPVEVFTGIRPYYSRDITYGFGNYGTTKHASYNLPRAENRLFISGTTKYGAFALSVYLAELNLNLAQCQLKLSYNFIN